MFQVNHHAFAEYLSRIRAQACNGPAQKTEQNPAVITQASSSYTVTSLHDNDGGLPNDEVAHPPTLEPACTPYSERTAIMEIDGGLPRIIAEGLALLDTMPAPAGFSPERWAAAVDRAARLADEWGAKALELGWSAEDLFGVHPACPGTRYDGKGLAFVLCDGDCVTAMDENTATILRPTGSILTFTRATKSSEAVAAWELRQAA